MSSHEEFLRRLEPAEVPPHSAEAWVTERMHGVAGYSLRVKRVLASERTPHQQIDLFETHHHGKVMMLDGCVMLTELDEFVYHEMAAHVGAQTLADPRRAVVIGGGDGGVIQELLKVPSFERITLAELDERVVRLSQEHLPGVAAGLSDPRVELLFGDGVAHLEERDPGELDLLVVDSTDPVGPAGGLITDEFYASAARALDDDGVLIAQTQSPFYHVREIRSIYAAVAKSFREVWMFWAVVPAYLGFLWTFCYASQSRRPLEVDLPADLHRTLGTRYYSADVHRAAFALPPFLQACLPEGHPQRQV